MEPIEKQGMVLIIDDSPDNVRLLRETLGNACDVLWARSGPLGLNLAGTAPQPDLILLDSMMPGMGGDEICRRLKSDPLTGRIPVLFITAEREGPDHDKGISAGAADYIRKPFHPALVLTRVKTHISLKRHMDKLEDANTALKVLLEKIEENRQELEANMLANIRDIILPCLEKIRRHATTLELLSSLGYMESCLKEVLSPFIRKLKSGFHGLTPSEMEVAVMIKHGRSTKEIADILSVSEKTVGFHRSSIREKLGIRNKPANLKTFLMSLE